MNASYDLVIQNKLGRLQIGISIAMAQVVHQGLGMHDCFSLISVNSSVAWMAATSPTGHLALFMGFTKDKENSHTVYDPVTCEYVKKNKKMMKKLAK